MRPPPYTAWLLSVISAGASIGQALAAQAPAERPPPGRLIDIGGFRLHLDCRGTGRQVVVIDVGAGGWSISFTHIQQAITDEARVCTYDRAGMGWSDLGPAPRTSDRMANELHALLRRAGVPAPYVLVGHSLGGLTMRAFAAARPDEVAGIVLVESAHEEQWKRLPSEAFAALGATLPRLRAAAAAARAGRLGPPQPGPVPQASREVQTIYAAAMTTPKPYEGFAAEIEGVMLDARAPVSPRPLGDLPLTVVTAGNSFAAFEGSGIPREAANGAWMQLQSELVGLSTRGVQFVIDSANHRIHATHPDFIVRAIRHMLRATRDTATRMGSGDEWDGIVRGDARSAETRKHPGKKWRR